MIRIKIVMIAKDRMEKFPGELDWSLFDSYDIEYYENISRTEELAAVQEAEILLTSHVRLDQELLDQAPKLEYIILLSTGYNNVDLATCRKRGIKLSNVPSYGTEIVAQFTIALMLEAAHRIGEHSLFVKEGGWGASDDYLFWQSKQIELDQKKLGIIGYGRIGKKVGEIAQALGMKLITAGRNPEDQKRVFQEADFISLHANLSKDNYHLINQETIEQMKDGVVLINTARGGLVDEEALYQALKRGKIGLAAVDVAEKEPMDKNHPLLTLDNFIITPHMAWGAQEPRQRMLNTAQESLAAYLEGRPINLIN